MPVRFEGKSEYQRRFEGGDPNDPPLPAFYQRPDKEQKLLPSNNGMTHEPAIQHKKPVISHGMPQDSHSYTVLEPPIQRKKKPVTPHGSKTTQETANGAEYVLLGSQEKFTPNIIYKAKPTLVSKEPEAVEEKVAETPLAPRPDPPPAPKVVVDTGVPAKLAKTTKDASTNVHQPAPKEKKARTSVKVSPQKPQEQVQLKKTVSPSKPEPKQAPQQSVPKPTKSSEVPKTHRVQKDKNSQTNGTSPQKEAIDQEASPEYALKYKAGIAPHRSRGPKRVSEYQMQYAWKKAVGASPLLDAEQVVYKSSTQLVPTKAEFAKTSEYRKQYQSWDVGSVLAAAHSAADSNKSRMRRSKSVDARPERKDPAGVTKVTTPYDPRLVQESLNPQRLHFPHGPQKKEVSEYARNYMAPSNFLYDDGVWKGAVANTNTEQPKEADPVDTPQTSWFAEVVELRNKADEYKKRARGTHFSRQHVAQLLAQQTELWDTASNSSVLSALSLERPMSDRSIPIAKDPVRSKPQTSPDKPPAGKRTAWGHDRDPPSYQDNGSLFSGTCSPSVASAVDQLSEISDTPTLVEDQESEPLSAATASSLEGRLPTPVIPDSKRHHLDRTTPLVGGALLSSPAAARKAKGKRKLKHPRAASESGSSEVQVAEVEPAARIIQSQTSKHVNSLVKPTYGKPTPDAHFLLDDDASTDRPMSTKFVSSPPRPQNVGHHNRDRFPAASIPSTIQEGGAATFKANGVAPVEVRLSDIPPRPDLDDDVLSISARSVASSCSLASDVLDRARQRRDNFWDQKRGISGHA